MSLKLAIKRFKGIVYNSCSRSFVTLRVASSHNNRFCAIRIDMFYIRFYHFFHMLCSLLSCIDLGESTDNSFVES